MPSPQRTKLLAGRAQASAFYKSYLQGLMAARPGLGEASATVTRQAVLLILIPEGRKVGRGILVIK